jgi:carboxymethylenebutenolidase
MGSTIEFTRPDGATAPGFLAKAPHPGAPGVVMFGEWWGVTDHLQETASKLASSGFDVLVPDLYRGRVAATGDEANHLMEGLDFGDAISQDARGAAAYLREHGANKVGVSGFCMGGALAMLCAMKLTDFDAAVVFYGLPPADAGDPGDIKIPIQGHWALHDEFFGIDRVDAMEKRLHERGVPHEFHRYDAKHGFTNPNGPGESGLGNHHPEHAATAWKRAVEFLKKQLG